MHIYYSRATDPSALRPPLGREDPLLARQNQRAQSELQSTQGEQQTGPRKEETQEP